MGKVTAPVPLGTSHILAEFHCGEPVLDEWIKHRGLKISPQGGQNVCGVPGKCFTGACLLLSRDRQRHSCHCAGKPAKEYARSCTCHHPGPSCCRYELSRPGLGADLLHDAVLRCCRVAENIGVRAVMVHALSDSARQFYIHHGFIPSQTQDRTLFYGCLSLLRQRS